MRTLRDWVEHVNTKESNISAEVFGDHLKITLFGYYAVDIHVMHDLECYEELAEVFEWELDQLELELNDGGLIPTTMAGVNPHGLTAYIKEAY